ncbi:exosortase family protein XrtF [Flavobacterium sp. 5]|uniref:exosortase family protein XrtF n=1 Tax=Flavobacterium sp. 5 TaxID=2035199 RepID=UPI000C2C719C|nr:exosortase family protein XrtF [Flavobacterium sp. 5]PKB16012.1 exosortase family protein XrtF [Flavobacterium sp. 5]
MKKYFVEYKPFLVFLASFFGCYILLTFVYQFFLSGFGSSTVDTITQVVAKNSEKVISWFFMRVQSESVVSEPFVRMYFQNQYIVRIVEGCNGISVIILFISFIVAFSGSLKNTLLFIFGGTVLIYILNVLRIAVLIVLMYYFPEKTHLLHGVLFPVIIYGIVFILWVIWVNKFSKYAK